MANKVVKKNWTGHVVRHKCWKTLPTNYGVKHICQALRWKVSRGNHLLQILSAPETMFFNCQLVSLGISGAIVNTKYDFFFKSSHKKQFIINTKIVIETKSSLSSCTIPEVKKKYSFKWKIHAVVWRPSWLCRECLNISLKHHFSQFYCPNKFLKGE